MDKIIEASNKLSSIIEKCWEDDNYKQEFVKNPSSKLFDSNSNNLNLVVCDQTNDDVIYFNIPPKKTLEDLDELSLTDEQLDLVSAGGWPAVIAALGLATMSPLAAVALGVATVGIIVTLANE